MLQGLGRERNEAEISGALGIMKSPIKCPRKAFHIGSPSPVDVHGIAQTTLWRPPPCLLSPHSCMFPGSPAPGTELAQRRLLPASQWLREGCHVGRDLSIANPGSPGCFSPLSSGFPQMRG